MRLHHSVVSLTCLLSLLAICGSAAQAADVVPAAADKSFVAIPPCRLLDTRTTPPANPGEQTLRHIDIAATRCGRMLPAYATAYSIRTSRYSPTPVQGELPDSSTSRLPTNSARAHDLAVPTNAHVAIDVEGYYLPPGMSEGPDGASTSATQPNSSIMRVPDRDSASSGSTPRAQGVVGGSGTAGDVVLDASFNPFTSTGVLMRAASGTPHIVARIGTSDASSSFWVYNASNYPILRVSGDGTLRLNGFISSGTDYWGSGPRVIGNVVQDVTMVNPLDTNSSNANRVILYRGRTIDEVGSPATTKFEASTLGYYNQPDINFDSQITYHFPGYSKYHFRAYSAYEGKETFWVKAATNGDSITNTRADMYVSGRVGIGTTTPSYVLDVSGRGRFTGWGSPATTGAGVEVGYDGANGYVRNYDRGASAWKPLLLDGSSIVLQTGGSAGNVGIGIPNPLNKLSVAGTIESTTGVKFPDGNTQTVAYLGSSYVLPSATNVTAGAFGANAGGGNYSFPANLQISNYASFTSGDVGGSSLRLGPTLSGAYPMDTLLLQAQAVSLYNGYGRVGLSGTISARTGGGTYPGYMEATAALVRPAYYNLNGGLQVADYTTTGNQSVVVRGGIADSAAAVSVYVDSLSSLTTAGAKIASFRNSTVEKAYIDKDGGAHFSGSVQVDGTLYANYQDVAEWVPAAKSMVAGTVVVISDDSNNNTVTASTHAYDTGVAGVVSPTPGLLLGVSGISKAKIATTGRVKVRVDASKAPIRKGDLLVTSERPGMAMKSEPINLGGVKLHRPGTLIGKALEPLAGGEGEILVLLSLQ
jgi:hypothetical protein